MNTKLQPIEEKVGEYFSEIVRSVDKEMIFYSHLSNEDDLTLRSSKIQQRLKSIISSEKDAQVAAYAIHEFARYYAGGNPPLVEELMETYIHNPSLVYDERSKSRAEDISDLAMYVVSAEEQYQETFLKHEYLQQHPELHTLEKANELLNDVAKIPTDALNPSLELTLRVVIDYWRKIQIKLEREETNQKYN